MAAPHVCLHGTKICRSGGKAVNLGAVMVESEYIWDPLRKKSVRNTPEEAVRQWFISVLHEGMGVPEHMMGSEVALEHAGKKYRADIVEMDELVKALRSDGFSFMQKAPLWEEMAGQTGHDAEGQDGHDAEEGHDEHDGKDE